MIGTMGEGRDREDRERRREDDWGGAGERESERAQSREGGPMCNY